MLKQVAIIGSGFSGLSAAAYAARPGAEVHVFEKHKQPGGRARQFVTEGGYRFDMGPSWYWMPDIIEGFFRDFGFKSAEFFDLVSLDPQFEVVFSEGNITVPYSFESLKMKFEALEKGSGKQLEKFMASARLKYEIGMQDFVNKPCHNWTEFLSPKLARSAFKMDLLTNFRKYVSNYFSNPKLKALMEFPVIFLGAPPAKIPAMYSLMNYGGYVLGTRYPMGGFYQLVLAMKKVAEKQGVKFHFNQTVEKIIVGQNNRLSLQINKKHRDFDAVISSSDYHHTEGLLPPKFRNYTANYWESRILAPSCLIYYLGFRERIPNIGHHTLFFENDFENHIASIYEEKTWPEEPLFYACCPSKTDPHVAPQGHENIFLLMPIAAGIAEGEALRERYFQKMITRLEKHVGVSGLLSKIDYKRSYCASDFYKDYNAFRGNAYGLANTLRQTAVLKPKIRNKKLKNLFYTGQLTVPGPGVPPSIISGKIVARELNKLKNPDYEKTL